MTIGPTGPANDPPGRSDRDRIEIMGLRAVGVCGVLPHEREQPQPFEIDLTLYTDLADAGRSDDLADTVDYGDMAQVVEAIVSDGRFQLIEALAEAIATAALGHDRVEAVTVSVRKLRPPVPLQVSTTGVTIQRSRPSPP